MSVATAEPTPRADYVLWVDTDEPQSVYTPPQVVTALPTTGLYSGLEVYYQMPDSPWQTWHLRYNYVWWADAYPVGLPRWRAMHRRECRVKHRHEHGV